MQSYRYLCLSIYLVAIAGTDSTHMESTDHYSYRHHKRRSLHKYSTSRSRIAKPMYKQYTSSTYELYRYLMKHYKPVVRPVINPADTIVVGVYTYVYQIVEVDQPTNTIVLSACFELFWQDEFLTWDPEDYGGITETFFPSESIWTPEISAYYSVASNRMLERYTYLRVNHTGGVRYFSPFAVKNLCHVDVKYFPFDKQICTLYFGPWAYRMTELDWKLLRNTADNQDFYDNQEWQLQRTKMQRIILKYDYLGQQLNYSCFTLELHIYRQSFYYIFNLVIPTAIIALVSVVGFHMPSSSAQMRDAKFRLGIMTILSMTMLLLAVVDDMPKFALTKQEGKRGSSSSVPLIGIYYFSLLAIIGLGTVTSSLFVSMERHVRHRKVPFWLFWLSWSPSDMRRGYKLSQTEPLQEMATEDAICLVKRKTTAVIAHKDKLDRTISCCHVPSNGRDTSMIHASVNHNVPGTRGRSYGALISDATHNANISPTMDSVSELTSQPTSCQTCQTAPRGGAQREANPSAPSAASNAVFLERVADELLIALLNIERSVLAIRKELYAFMPKNTIHERWLVIINRLEWISMIIYLMAVLISILMFFYHDWY